MIKKCLFPAAGYGTRFLPATKAVPKEMLPVLNFLSILSHCGPTTSITCFIPILGLRVISFKWKPPEHNTIDFMVTIQKGSDGSDDIKSVFR